MEHNHFEESINHGFPHGILTLIIIVGVLAIILLIYYILKKRKVSSDKPVYSDKQKETIENFYGLVSDMLTQYGKGLRQTDITKNLGLPVDVVAEKLLEMEDEGLIEREWDNDEDTFTIIKRND